jgi:hypothetical protein
MDADMPPLAKAGFYSCEYQNPLPRQAYLREIQRSQMVKYVYKDKLLL